METYGVIGVGPDRSVGYGTIPDLLHGRILVGRSTGMRGVIDGIGNAVDESDHGMLPVSDMITKPQTEDTSSQE
jgi:hypothetical protein